MFTAMTQREICRFVARIHATVGIPSLSADRSARGCPREGHIGGHFGVTTRGARLPRTTSLPKNEGTPGVPRETEGFLSLVSHE